MWKAEGKTGLFADQWFKLKTKHPKERQETSRRNPENNGDKQTKWADHKVRGQHQDTPKRKNIDNNSENKGKEEGRTSLRW